MKLQLYIIIIFLAQFFVDICSMEKQITLCSNSYIDNCNVEELKSIRYKSLYEQREIFKKMSNALPSLHDTIDSLSFFSDSHIIIWFTDYNGQVYANNLNWFKRNILEKENISDATVWLTDLNAWSFLSNTKEYLFNAKKSRTIAESLINNSIVSFDQCPLLNYSSSVLTDETVENFNNRLKVLSSKSFFRWLFNQEGKIDQLYGNIHNSLSREQIRPNIINFTLRQIGFDAPFLDCFIERLNCKLVDADSSQVFSILQYLEGLYYATQVIDSAVTEDKTNCDINFVLHNKEFTYYMLEQDDTLFESFIKNISLFIKNTYNGTVAISFIPFRYGENIYDSPYSHSKNSGKSLNKDILKKIFIDMRQIKKTK